MADQRQSWAPCPLSPEVLVPGGTSREAGPEYPLLCLDRGRVGRGAHTQAFIHSGNWAIFHLKPSENKLHAFKIIHSQNISRLWNRIRR